MKAINKDLDIVVIPTYVRDTIHSLGYRMGDFVSLVYSDRKIEIVKIFKKISKYDLRDAYFINEIFNQYILGKKCLVKNDIVSIMYNIASWDISITEMTDEDKLEVIELLVDKTMQDRQIFSTIENINSIVDYEIVDKYLFIYPKIGFGNLLLNINSIKDKENNINFNEWFIRNINDYVFNKIDRTTFYNSSLFKRLTRLIINKK